MYNKQWLWLGSLVAMGIITATTSVTAQVTNQSDTTGHNTFSAPATGIDAINGNGITPITIFDSVTGDLTGGVLDTPITLSSETASGGSSTGVPIGCSTKICLDQNGNEPTEVTLNDVAEILENNLQDSLNKLATAENADQVASDSGPRRIARRSGSGNPSACGCANATDSSPRRIARKDSSINASGCGCANPDFEDRVLESRVIEARETVEKQLDESKKFIEQVNRIEPDKNIW